MIRRQRQKITLSNRTTAPFQQQDLEKTMATAVGTAPATLESLRTPALIVDQEIAVRNAQAMLASAKSLGCRLRPHVKTHKTVEGALLQTGGRKHGITVVSSPYAQSMRTGPPMHHKSLRNAHKALSCSQHCQKLNSLLRLGLMTSCTLYRSHPTNSHRRQR